MAINTTNPPFPGGVFRGSDRSGNIVWYDPAIGKNRWFNGTTEIGSAASRGAPTPSGRSGAAAGLPAPRSRPALPITAGQYDDYMAQAKSAMSRLGIMSREPSDAEIVQFAQSGFDAEHIADYFSFLPEFVNENPGLPYGLSKEQYRQSVAGYGEAYRGVFGQDIPDVPTPRSRRDLESSLVGFGLTRGLSTSAFSQTAEKFRQERGRAPTTQEFVERLNRPTQRVGTTDASPGYTQSDTGPVAPGLRGASKGAARPAL